MSSLPPPRVSYDRRKPLSAAQTAEAYAEAASLSESEFGDALAIASEVSLILERRGLPQRWGLLDGRALGDRVRRQPRDHRLCVARHGGEMLLVLVRSGHVSAVRALTILRNFRFGLRTCDGSRRIIDAQRQYVRDLILAQCTHRKPEAAPQRLTRDNAPSQDLH